MASCSEQERSARLAACNGAYQYHCPLSSRRHLMRSDGVSSYSQVKQISSELLAGIVFTSNMVVTLSRASTVKVFMRPEQRF
jgi:hypothetical protein